MHYCTMSWWKMVLLMPLQQSNLHHTIFYQKRNWHHKIALKHLWMFKQLPSNVWNHSLYPHDVLDVIFEFARSIFTLRNVDFESLECQMFFTTHVILSFDLSILDSPNAHLLLYKAWTTTVLRIEFEGFILSLILWKSAPEKAFLTILQFFGCVIKDTQFAQLDICFSICLFVLSNLKNHYLCLLCIKFHMSCFHICWCIFAISWLN